MSRDDEQVWADLVESFNAPPGTDEPQWPAAEDVGPDDSGAEEPVADAPAPTQALAEDADDHFVPPPPPPLPRGDRVSRLAWIAVLGVPVFLVLAVAVGWRLSSWLSALAVGVLIGGFATLVARMRGRDPYDPDDGAVV
ncbi:MAG: hypothetical protein ACRDWI_15130 [Jiangellaceae bacterium]